jgi:Spy/CpxP family protein refolding chaperone
MWRRWLGVSALAAVVLVAAGLATASAGWPGHGRHFGHHGPRAWDEEDIRFAVGWLLREADASDEQVARVSEIASAAALDLRALHEAHRARREPFAQALVAADRAALERLRGEELAAAEAASRRIVLALADTADVLTPEQRQRLAEAHAQHHGHE